MSLMDIFVDLQYGNFKIGSFNHLLNISMGSLSTYMLMIHKYILVLMCILIIRTCQR